MYVCALLLVDNASGHAQTSVCVSVYVYVCAYMRVCVCAALCRSACAQISVCVCVCVPGNFRGFEKPSVRPQIKFSFVRVALSWFSKK